MNKDILKRILKYTEKYKAHVFGSFIAAILSVTSSLIGPILIGKSIDHMIGIGAVDFRSLFKTLIILALIYAIGNLFVWLLTYLTNWISYQTVNDMRHQLFDKISTLPLKFYDTHPHGDTISHFINDIDAISDGMLHGISTLLTAVVTIVGAIGFMLYISPIMTIVVLFSAPASFLMARFIANRSQQMFKAQARNLGKLNDYVEEIISGQKVVKAFNYEDRSFKEFKKINNTLHSSGLKSQFYGSLSGPTTRLINNITYSTIGVIGSTLVILGKITVGDISSFLIYSNLFAKPFNDITGILTQIQSAIASAQRIFYIIDMPSERPDAKDAINIKHSQGKINFNNVTFSYNPQRPLITDFNLNVRSGTRIAIVGKTGAGKTTLVNLLMRFYDIDNGSISIDGIDIRNITRDSLRSSFGMVLQDTWLFSGTIRDNISYGNPNATDKEIIAASKSAEAHNFIKSLPNGYNTLISDAGGNLSQGQKQLLTIARVMLVDPPMLILDEATSNIDTRTEIHIQKAFLKMVEGRTSFVIAHRLSTIREADLILVMDNGNIVESGTHNQLLKNGGYYERLYNSQFIPA
ncbi:ABC transporter ATP-binding protein [uncultured Tissierella sp.]|jgi:ATP-binding cassette subfamily B multidrug efflux pump|uniref:ABC transporter ATP-binding protein n=1 Tax=uncultured Tissierella sp. TaxID=448160 RepID=UPI0028064E2F|nr:ABC transporter ATP-binding protein [uncultured Tissierella sp.]MDU5081493.1 ABC transporter ATP-binding protein [Bacillota bacterium]